MDGKGFITWRRIYQYMVITMTWTVELVSLTPKDTLIERITELLKRMGFREYEKVASGNEWGIDVVAIREDPIAGTEKLVMVLHEKGLVASRDVNVFGGLLDRYKADKGVIVSPAGFTKDAKLLISREYRGRIIPWDGKKLSSLLNNYGVEVPHEVLQIASERCEKESENEDVLNEFDLDAPLLYDFSPEDVLKKVASFAASSYPIEPNEIELKSLTVDLRTAYIISWSAGEEKDRALVFSKDNIALRASSGEKFAVPVKKALLNGSAKIKATERRIETPLTPGEAVLILKTVAAGEIGVNENRVSIQDRQKVYVPSGAELELQVGENSAKASVDLIGEKVNFRIEPLPEGYFITKTREVLKDETGERPKDLELEKGKKKLKVRGNTERFSFEAVFNPYTGRLIRVETLMSDEALEKLLSELYPGGKVLNLEKGKKIAVADILASSTIIAVQVYLRNGEVKEVRKLPSPEAAFSKAKAMIEANFPVSGLFMHSYRVSEHKYLEIKLEGEDGRATVKIDGATGDILDYYVEISEKRAGEIVLEKYPGFRITSVMGNEDEYTVEAEDETHSVKVRLSKDGKILEEVDRVLRRSLAERLAEERAKEIDPEARVESVELRDNWIVEFSGVTRVGRLVLDRATGEVLERNVRMTEMALEEAYHRHLREEYGEESPRTERLTHYKEGGYVNIKVSGRDRLYYAKIDTGTGRILSEDTAPIRGLTAKIKQLQLEGKYK